MNPYHDEDGRFSTAAEARGPTPTRSSPEHSERHRAAVARGEDPRDRGQAGPLAPPAERPRPAPPPALADAEDLHQAGRAAAAAAAAPSDPTLAAAGRATRTGVDRLERAAADARHRPVGLARADGPARRRRTRPARRAEPAPAPPPPPALTRQHGADLAARLGVAPTPPEAPGDRGPRLLTPAAGQLRRPRTLGQLHDGLYNGLQKQLNDDADRKGLRIDHEARPTTPLRDTVNPRGPARRGGTPMKGRGR